MSDGKLVIKTDELIKLGSEVYDDSNRHVGTVVDYFGPTMGPYMLVSAKKDPGKLVGEYLYA